MEPIDFGIVLAGSKKQVSAFTEGTLGNVELDNESVKRIFDENEEVPDWFHYEDMIGSLPYDKKRGEKWWSFTGFFDPAFDLAERISLLHPDLKVRMYVNDRFTGAFYATMIEFIAGNVCREYYREYGCYDIDILYLIADVETNVITDHAEIFRKTLSLLRKWEGWYDIPTPENNDEFSEIFAEILEERLEISWDIADFINLIRTTMHRICPEDVKNADIRRLRNLITCAEAGNDTGEMEVAVSDISAWLVEVILSKQIPQRTLPVAITL